MTAAAHLKPTSNLRELSERPLLRPTYRPRYIDSVLCLSCDHVLGEHGAYCEYCEEHDEDYVLALNGNPA